ncbi:MAG: transposase [Phycisphaerales bacterium]
MAGQGKRQRHKPEEIVVELRQVDELPASGKEISDAARSLGVSEVMLHRWRQQYGTLQRDDVRRLKELQAENGRLKRLVADQALDIAMLKEVAKGEF